VSLVDMRVWRWLYAHPDASAAALREAVLAIAREAWDCWFAPRLGHPGCEVLAIYSHMLAYSLYLPDYALGHIVAFQLAAHLQQAERTAGARPGAVGAELERIARQGRLTPEAWMRGAVGGPVSAEALLAAARQALAAMPPAAAPVP
jgi:oligoendopeptidase F